MIRAGLVAIVLLLLAPSLGFAQAVEEPAVRKMLAEVDRAIAERNVDAVAHHLSESATFTVEINVDGQAQRATVSKPEYVTALRQTWSAVDDYTYRRSNEKISIRGGRAVVTATVVETMTLQGKTIKTTSQETAVIEMVAGRPQLTSATAKTEI